MRVKADLFSASIFAYGPYAFRVVRHGDALL